MSPTNYSLADCLNKIEHLEKVNAQLTEDVDFHKKRNQSLQEANDRKDVIIAQKDLKLQQYRESGMRSVKSIGSESEIQNTQMFS